MCIISYCFILYLYCLIKVYFGRLYYTIVCIFLCFSFLKPKEEKTFREWMVFTVYPASSLFLHGLHQKKFFWGADAAFIVSLRQLSSPSDKPWRSRQRCWRSIANTATLKLWGGETFRPASIFLFLFSQNSGKLNPIVWFDSKQTLNMWNIIHKCTYSHECTEN